MRNEKEIELEFFKAKNQNLDLIHEDLTDEIIDSMDINNLKTILKVKCEEIKFLDQKNKDCNEILANETNKINELLTIIRIQKQEIKRKNQLTIQLKKEINSLRNTNPKVLDISPLKANKAQNSFMENKEKDSENKDNDSKDYKTMKIQFSGDSDVSVTPEIENNNVVKKWFANEEKLSFNFSDLEIKLKKLIKPDNSYFYQSEMNNEFKFVEVEIFNVSSSSVSIKNVELDSSESNLLYL